VRNAKSRKKDGGSFSCVYFLLLDSKNSGLCDEFQGSCNSFPSNQPLHCAVSNPNTLIHYLVLEL
jgi:hypothetical protein